MPRLGAEDIRQLLDVVTRLRDARGEVGRIVCSSHSSRSCSAGRRQVAVDDFRMARCPRWLAVVRVEVDDRNAIRHWPTSNWRPSFPRMAALLLPATSK